VVRPPGTGTETWNSKASVRRRLGRSSARSAVSKGPWGVRLLVEDDAQQGFVDLDAPVVLDEAELPELVHEVVHARARGPPPSRQGPPGKPSPPSVAAAPPCRSVPAEGGHAPAVSRSS